jgi:hypothetical protein
MLRITSEVPPSIEFARDRRNWYLASARRPVRLSPAGRRRSYPAS